MERKQDGKMCMFVNLRERRNETEIYIFFGLTVMIPETKLLVQEQLCTEAPCWDYRVLLKHGEDIDGLKQALMGIVTKHW